VGVGAPPTAISDSVKEEGAGAPPSTVRRPITTFIAAGGVAVWSNRKTENTTDVIPLSMPSGNSRLNSDKSSPVFNFFVMDELETQ
jgi:hypothetical protein